MTIPASYLLNQYSAIGYAHRAAAAAMVLYDYAEKQNNAEATARAEKAQEDAYCAAGFAWACLISDSVTEIEFCMKDAHRAMRETNQHIVWAIKASEDVLPLVSELLNQGCKMLLEIETAFETARAAWINVIETREAYIAAHGEAGAPQPGLSHKVIGEMWDTFIEQFPNAFLVPKTLSEIAAAETTRIDEFWPPGSIKPESLADAIAFSLAAERGPKGACRYCGKSFDKAKESVNPGRCLQCDKTLITEMMAGMFDVFSYDPETGETVYGDLPKDDASDDAAHSLN